MNLLNDHRDQSWVQVSEEPLIAAPPTSQIVEEPEAEETTAAEQPLTAPPEPQDWEYAKKPRNIAVPFLFSVLALLAIIVGSYAVYKYINRPKPVAQTTEQAEPVTTKPQESKPAETKPEETKVAQEKPLQAIPTTETSSRGLAMIEENLNVIVRLLPADVKMNTLILDGYSFSAEVSAASMSSIQSYYNQLKSAISGNVTLSPSGKLGGMSRAVISGLFSEKPPKPSPLRGTMNTAEIRKDLQRIASNVGVTIQDLVIRRFAKIGNVNKASVFVKIRGPVAKCQSYYSEIVKQGIIQHVSKVILQASNPTQAVCVLRLQLIRP